MTQAFSTSTGDIPAIIVLGTDALLAARPATPVQLAHACLAAGYRAAFPVSWGDELLAGALSARAAKRYDEPLIACTCPFVATRFVGSELDGFLLTLTSPPVATARYLRELFGHVVHITFVGSCPAAADPAINARYAPGEFLARLRELGIEVEEQPVVFESVIPPDRRRYDSLPGGVPTNEALRRAGAKQKLVEFDGEDFVVALAEQLLSREAALIDVAPRLGCACAGATSGGSLRPAIAALEPPRARGPVVDPALAVSLESPPPILDVPAPAARGDEAVRQPEVPIAPAPATAAVPVDEPPLAPEPAIASDVAPEREAAPIATAATAAAAPPTAAPAMEPPLPDETASRRSPAYGVPRLGTSAPVSRTHEGTVVPRAYLHRRRALAEDAPVARAAVPQPDRQAEIATHAEPETLAAELPAIEEPRSRSEPERSIELEVPVPRVSLPPLTATDLVPPPPIMPDPYFGDALIVADSLSELIGMEAASNLVVEPPPPERHPAPMSARPPEPTTTPRPAPVPPSSPSAAPDRVRPTAEDTRPADTPLTAPVTEAPAPSPIAPARRPPPASPRGAPVVRPMGGSPDVRPPEQIPPIPRAGPFMTPGQPLASGRVTILPLRRRGTAVVLWLLLASVLTLGVVGARYVIRGALAAAPTPPVPKPTRTEPAPATTVPSALPALSPVIVDSASVPADTASAGAAAGDSVRGSTSDTAAAPTAVAPPRPPARRLAPPRNPRPAPLRSDSGDRPARAMPSMPVARPAPRAADSARTDSTTVQVADSSARFNVPRVTRPWPPPAQR